MKRMFVILTMALVMAALMALNASGPVFAKITTTSSTGPCTNQGGNQPGGQQPTCVGGGLTQTTTASANNPAGHQPPGQQP